MKEPGQAFDVSDVLKRAIIAGDGFDAALVELDPGGLTALSPTLIDYVRATIVHFLHKRLAVGDAILPTDNGVAVIFDDIANRDPGATREQLQSALNTLLAGDPRLQGLRAVIRVFRMEKQTPAPLLARSSPTYFATAHYDAREGLHYGYSEEYRILGLHDDSNYLDVDLEILKRALSALRETHEAGSRFVIGYSVHSTTLQSDARRRAYLDALSAAPPHLRRHLSAKIAEIESAVPRATITDWVAQLRHASSRVSLEFSPNERRFEGLAATGAWAAGFLMPAFQPTSERMHVDQHGIIARWRQGLSRQHMRLFVDDILTVGAFDLACSEKVDFITSSVLWPASPHPQGMLRASRASTRAAFGDGRAKLETAQQRL